MIGIVSALIQPLTVSFRTRLINSILSVQPSRLSSTSMKTLMSISTLVI